MAPALSFQGSPAAPLLSPTEAVLLSSPAYPRSSHWAPGPGKQVFLHFAPADLLGGLSGGQVAFCGRGLGSAPHRHLPGVVLTSSLHVLPRLRAPVFWSSDRGRCLTYLSQGRGRKMRFRTWGRGPSGALRPACLPGTSWAGHATPPKPPGFQKFLEQGRDQ